MALAIIVGAPAAGEGLAVRRGTGAAARLARKWTRRTGREREARGPEPPSPASASTPAAPRL